MKRPSTGADLNRLRRMNALSALNAVRTAGMPLTLSALAQRTGLSRASAEDLAGELFEQGWVVDVPPAAGTVGRPARRLRFRAEAGHVVGLDVGLHKVLAVVADLAGGVLGSARVGVQPETGRADRLSAADAAVRRALEDAGIGVEQLWSVGAGTTGVVDEDGTVVLSTLAAEWTGAPLGRHLGNVCAGPVAVDNDSRLAALAEHRRGAAIGVDDVVYVHAGLQVSGALIIGGRLHRGFSGAAAEIGSLPVAAWSTATRHLTECPAVPDETPVEEAAAAVLAAARRGDAEAILAVDRFSSDLSVGAATMVATLDPEVVVLGGGVARSADVLLPRLESELASMCVRVPELRPSPLGDECVALGAVHLALDRVDAALFGPQGELRPPGVPTREAG
ncbi:ROK family transcriptional regulator [Phytoactinopolyspora halotolerans]|uniref:ROK family transcriptional regulator n=1 Tax=Phytoactinopolyspora halotolerans TaxID=1981512 RepID=A0A6L9SBL5_9ACTN|nr:ROK family transcriptional regulator [Phytoactinopolyspora halotolerans]NEE01400.1 ROK family transcriptional regulator [Phytoactinopolyspora halotolerans]